MYYRINTGGGTVYMYMYITGEPLADHTYMYMYMCIGQWPIVIIIIISSKYDMHKDYVVDAVYMYLSLSTSYNYGGLLRNS